MIYEQVDGKDTDKVSYKPYGVAPYNACKEAIRGHKASEAGA